MSTWRGVNPDTRPKLSLSRNPITDILGVTSRAAEDVAKTTAGIGLETIDTATGNTLSRSGADNVELAGLLGFLANPMKGGKAVSALSKLGSLLGWGALGHQLASPYIYDTPEEQELKQQQLFKEEREKQRQKQGILTREELFPPRDSSADSSPLSPADSLYWAKNW